MWRGARDVFAWVDTFAAPFDTRITPSFDLVLESIGNLMVYSCELSELRRREPGDDVISKMVAATDAGDMSEEELLGNVALLASGAAESTAAPHVQYHAPARAPLVIRATVLGGGRRVRFVEVVVEDEAGTRYVTAHGTMVVSRASA